jgi:murein DD-endopeptidase MepM/ murein hydrolase activator NlpD
MILCPVSGELGVDYHITQVFGKRPAYYGKYGLNGHNGLDLGIPEGTPLYAPFDGYLTYGNEGKTGYGRFATLVSDPLGFAQNRRRIDLGHLSRFISGFDGKYVSQGDLVAMSGNTGDSTGPHVHITYKKLTADMKTMDYFNGKKGAIDVSPWILQWTITHVLHS